MASAQSPPDAVSLPKNTAPTADSPIAVPIRCPVCSTPPAVPPEVCGISDSARVWFGAITSPPPAPASSSGPAIASPVHGLCAVAARTRSVTPSPTITVASPTTIIGCPKRATRRPLRAEVTAEPSANAVSVRPVCNGV